MTSIRPPFEIRRRPRRTQGGFAIVAVLGFLVFVFAMTSVIARTMAQAQQALESQAWDLQAETLMRSAAARARFRRAGDDQYTGETWSPPLALNRVAPNIEIRLVEATEGFTAEIKLLGNPPSLSKTSTYQIESDHVIPL